MTYKIPSDKELVDYIDKINTFIMEPSTDDCLGYLYRDINTSMEIAKLNINENRDYYIFLKYFLRYVNISEKNPDSSLRKKFNDYIKLRKLNAIL